MIMVELVRELYSPGNVQHLQIPYTYFDTQRNYGYGAQQDAEGHCAVPENPVWVGSELEWDADEIQQRPAIYVKLGKFVFSTINGQGHNTVIRHDVQTNTYHHARYVTAAAQVRHLGKSKEQAEDLQSHTIDLMDAFQDVIRRDLCWDRFSIVSADPAQNATEEADKRKAAVVGVRAAWQENWSIRGESPILRNNLLRAGLRVSDQLGLFP